MVVGKKHGQQGAGLFGDLIFALWPWSDTGPLGPLVFCGGGVVIRLRFFVQLSFFSVLYQSSVCAVRGALVLLGPVETFSE